MKSTSKAVVKPKIYDRAYCYHLPHKVLHILYILRITWTRKERIKTEIKILKVTNENKPPRRPAPKPPLPNLPLPPTRNNDKTAKSIDTVVVSYNII